VTEVKYTYYKARY